MAIEEVVPGVQRIGVGPGGRAVSAYLISDNELTLVDCGLPGTADVFLTLLRDLGRQSSELRHVLITHHHVDHTGALAALAVATGARVYAHPKDAGMVRDGAPRPRGAPTGALGRILAPLFGRMAKNRVDAAPVHHELVDGEDLPIAGGVRAIHTPGHTPGHVSFLWARRGVLFVGDAAQNLFGLRLAIVAEDIPETKRSLRKLAALEFDTACFGHGAVLRGRANAAFRRWVERQAG